LKKSYIGPVMITTSYFWLTCMNIAFKYSWINGSTVMLTLVARNVGQFLVNYLVMQTQNPKLDFTSLRWNGFDLCLLRGILSTFTSLFSVLGVFYLDITESIILSLTKPFLNFLLNRLIFKDPIQSQQLWSGVLCFIGLLFVVQPPWLVNSGEYMLTSGKLLGFVFRQVSVIWNSLGDLSLKKIGGKANPNFVIHFMSMLNASLFGMGYLIFDSPVIHNPACYLSLFMVGFTSFFCHLYYSKAFQHGESMNVTTVFEFGGVIMSFIADYFIFGKSYNMWCYVGVFIILLALYVCVMKPLQKP
jgi:drug/metabolite transporter (DMT)-like permease